MSGSDTVTLRSGVRYPRKLCEGWLEHKCHRANGSEYDWLWLVLKGNILYIFKDKDTVQENQIGSLTIDNQTLFIPEGGDRNKGFKFDLITRAKKNRFKSKKLAERELWRGYIMGVGQGAVPEDLDLLEDQVKKIRMDITALSTGQWHDMGNNRLSMVSGGSGDSGVETNSLVSGFSSGHTLIGSDGSVGGPTMKDKFYDDHTSPSPDQTTPSWFFSGCSREKAEDILTKCSRHGNTLMRESTSHMKSGSYVISKRVLDKESNTYLFEHYEVMRVAGGYKLNVQNEHNPMRCLTDVMEYFTETAGGSTHLMDTNDPFSTGKASDPEYQRHIRRSVEPEPWTWPPPDYEDPIEPETPSPVKYPGGGTNTVSPGILGNSRGPNQKKSVQFHPRNTYAGPSHRQKSETTISDIVHCSLAAAHLREFDAMIDSFETDHVYQNDEPMKNPEKETSQGVSTPRTNMPLPPTPHQGPSNHSYVNENHTDQALESLPVAPPPPRSSTAATMIGIGHDNANMISVGPVPPPPLPPPLPSQSTMVTFSVPVQTPVLLPVAKGSTPPKPAPKPVSSHSTDIGKPSPSISKSQTLSARTSQHTTLNHVSSYPGLSFQETVAQKRAQLKKVNSGCSGLGSKVNIKFPDTMPTWNSQLRNSAVTPNPSNSVITAQKTSHTEEVTAGVDESNPGGVHNISRMFEQSAQITPRRAGTFQGPQQTDSDAKNRHIQTGNRELKLTSNADSFTPPTAEALSRRRQTDPGPLKMQEVDKENRFNESFKRKLEGVLSGPLSPGGQRHVEHEYEELPIKPDAVTYADELED